MRAFRKPSYGTSQNGPLAQMARMFLRIHKTCRLIHSWSHNVSVQTLNLQQHVSVQTPSTSPIDPVCPDIQNLCVGSGSRQRRDIVPSSASRRSPIPFPPSAEGTSRPRRSGAPGRFWGELWVVKFGVHGAPVPKRVSALPLPESSPFILGQKELHADIALPSHGKRNLIPGVWPDTLLEITCLSRH